MQRGIILIYTDSTEKIAKTIKISGCPITKMNVRWANQWKGWEKSVFLPWGIVEAKKYEDLYDGVDLMIYAKANQKKQIEEKICSLVS